MIPTDDLDVVRCCRLVLAALYHDADNRDRVLAELHGCSGCLEPVVVLLAAALAHEVQEHDGLEAATAWCEAELRRRLDAMEPR
jgi:hypothetical protein